MNQAEQILRYIDCQGSIDTLAAKTLGIGNLRAAISRINRDAQRGRMWAARHYAARRINSEIRSNPLTGETRAVYY